jgi:hypothetical protein
MANYIQASSNNNPCKLLAVDYFAKAFKQMDLELIEPVLNKKGVFKGEDKKTFLDDLSRLFSGLKNMRMTIHPYFGIAKDFYPGAPVIEFHIEIHSGHILDTLYVDDYFGKNRGANFLIMKYGIVADDEKGIYSIFEPGDSFGMSQVKKCIIEN